MAKARDLGYSALGFLGATCIIGSIGHLIDWHTHRRTVDLEWVAGFIILGCIVLLFAPNRFFFIGASLAAILAFGFLGAITQGSLLGLWIMIPCALVLYFLIKWKGKNVR
jgi:hypothetical protein